MGGPGDIVLKHTRFEKARIIGARALQLNMGAPPLLKKRGNLLSVVEMAETEYGMGLIPINAKREA
jgi:DNA-directed RNA polymerase subunit K